MAVLCFTCKCVRVVLVPVVYTLCSVYANVSVSAYRTSSFKLLHQVGDWHGLWEKKFLYNSTPLSHRVDLF